MELRQRRAGADVTPEETGTAQLVSGPCFRISLLLARRLRGKGVSPAVPKHLVIFAALQDATRTLPLSRAHPAGPHAAV